MTPDAPIRALVLADSHRRFASVDFLGLTIVERILRNLRSRGVHQVTLVGDEALVPGDLSVDVAHEAPEEAINAALRELKPTETLLVVPGDVVYHPNSVPRLAAKLAESDDAAAMLMAEERADAAMVLVSGGASAELPPCVDSVSAWLGALRVHHRVEGVALTTHYDGADPDALFVVPFDTETAARARKLLVKLNWRPHDGIIAGLLNKHISVPISVVLSRTFITPNQMTAVAFLIALVGIGLTAVGTYQSFLLGAALVQIQSILDGCDGELARMRYLSSKFGAWFDTVVDDVIGVLWVIAVGYGTYRMTGQWLWFVVPAVSAGLYAIALSLVYLVLILNKASGHQDFVWFFEEGANPQADYPDKRKLSTWAKYVVRRDFYVLFFFCMAVLDLMVVVATVSSIAATAWFVIGMIHFKKRGLSLKPQA